MQGFRAADAPAEAPWFGTAPSYAMPSRWHRNTHEWQLRYTHPALRNPFLLEVFNNNGLVLLRLVEDTSLADTGGLNVHVRFIWPLNALTGQSHAHGSQARQLVCARRKGEPRSRARTAMRICHSTCENRPAHARDARMLLSPTVSKLNDMERSGPVQQLGLNLGIYVPDPEHLQATSWDEALEWPQMKRFTQHWHRSIYLPTRATAARASGEGAQGAWGAQRLLTSCVSDFVLQQCGRVSECWS